MTWVVALRLPTNLSYSLEMLYFRKNSNFLAIMRKKIVHQTSQSHSPRNCVTHLTSGVEFHAPHQTHGTAPPPPETP